MPPGDRSERDAPLFRAGRLTFLTQYPYLYNICTPKKPTLNLKISNSPEDFRWSIKSLEGKYKKTELALDKIETRNY